LLTNNSEISLNINDNIGDPLAASSPKPPPPPRNKKRFYVQNNLITVLTVNFRSCKNKVPQIENLLTSFKPDIIIGSETWLNKNVLSYEGECLGDKHGINIVLEWFGVSHTGQIQRTEVFPYFSYMDGLMLAHPI
jgi:hypothetical protein